MTVIPLHRPGSAALAYRTIRPRSLVTAGHTVEAPDALTVSFEVTLAGEARYREALEIIDGLRELTVGLDGVVLDVAPRDGHSPVRAATPAARTGEPFPEAPGAVRILPAARRVLLDGQSVALTRIEFDLLRFLADHPQRVFSRLQLLQQVWGYEHTGERTVDVHIRRIRAKLGDLAVVQTLRGIGYRLADGVDVRVVEPD